MTAPTDAEVIAGLLTAIEERDDQRTMALFHPDIEFRWQPGLPYGGTFSGPQVDRMNKLFGSIWKPLQPTEETRRIDFQIVATGDDGQVIVRYTWKGIDAHGKRFETPTLAYYQVRDDMLWRAEMYYFDLAGLIAFLKRADMR